MASYNRPASGSLTASSSKPTTSSSLRNAVHRKRSASSSDDDSSVALPSDDSPVVKKGRYERKELTGGLLGKALDGVATQSAPSTPSTSAHRLPSKSVDALSTPRSQFEQQEDFISFGFDDEPSSSRSSRKPAKTAIPSSAGGRVLDQYETKQEEHSKRVQKREKGRTTPWCEDPGVDWTSCTSAIDMLNKEAHAFITYISPTPIEHQLRMWSVELIRRAIKSRWADAEVECFGSVGTGLYLPGGDIDLVVLCPSFPSPPLKPTSSLLHSLASLLLTTSLADPSSLLVIAKSRVPIVKFTTRHGGFAVDLSVNQKNGVDAAGGVRQLLEDYSFRLPDHVEHGSVDKKEREEEKEEGEVENLIVDHGVARSLVLLVKAFLNQRGMNEVFTGGLGSYSIICLVVSFLQLHPKIQTGVIHPAHNIGLLLVEFLEYYGKHFNFDEAGISLRKNGGYFNKHNKGWWRQNQPYLLSIEDPNDPSNDVSGGSHNIIRVRQTMAGAFEVLAATLCQRSSAFSLSNPSSTSTTSYELSKSALPTADPSATSSLRQSVLGGILGISLPSLKSREDNIDLFNEGILQDLIEQGVPDDVGMSKKGQRKLIKEEKAKRTREKTLRKLEGRQKEREEKIAAKEKRKRVAEQEENEEEFIVENPATKLFTGKSSSSSSVKKVAEGDGLFMIDTEPSDSRYSINSPAPASRSTTAATEIIYINDGDSDNDSDFSSVAGAGGRDSDVIMGGADSGDKISSRVPSKASSVGDDTQDSDEESEDDDEAVSVALRPAPTATPNGTKQLSSKAKKHAIRLARKQEKARKAKEEEIANPGAAAKAIAAAKLKKAKKAEKKAEKKAKYWAAKGEVLPPIES